MKELVRNGGFEAQLARAFAAGLDLDDWEHFAYLLIKGAPLPSEYHEHQLTDNWSGYTECHLTGDLVVIYKVAEKKVRLVSIGGHAEVFRHRKRKRPMRRGVFRWFFGQ